MPLINVLLLQTSDAGENKGILNDYATNWHTIYYDLFFKIIL